MYMAAKSNPRARAWARIVEESLKLPNGCWEWTGARWGGGNKRKYGTLQYKGRQRSAHVVSYLIFKGKYPKGMDIEHICQFSLCVNPEHLQPATRLQNIRRDHPWLNEGNLKCGHAKLNNNSYCPTCHIEERIKSGSEYHPRGFCHKGHDLTKVKTVCKGKGKRRCSICLNEYLKMLRLRSIEKGLCAYIGCKLPPVQGLRLCEKHNNRMLENGRRHYAKTHAKG